MRLRRLDALVLKELIGPWLFGVMMFSMLLIAATYLGRIARYVVQGVPGSMIAEVTVLFLPAILVQTFAMAVLLGALLAFGRLSGDSEITAVRASGVSLYRIVLPVAVFSLCIAGLAFFLNEKAVPYAARRSAALLTKIATITDPSSAQPIQHVEKQAGKVVAMMGAENFSLLDGTLQNAYVLSMDKQGHYTYTLYAKELQWTNLNQWRIRGGAELVPRDGSFHMMVGEIWPKQVPVPTVSPEDLFASLNKDMNLYSMAETKHVIDEGRRTGNLTEADIRNYEYGYWNKIALPLAAFIFGTLGATLGIRNHRTGTAAGFALSIGIIFAYFMLANFMNVFATGGVFPPYVASFAPIALGLIASGVVMWRRNA